MRYLQDEALNYLRLGYVPLVVPLGTKAAQMKGWQNMQPTEEDIGRHFGRPSNLGIRTGDVHPDGSCLIGVDIDIEAGELVRCVEQAIGDAVPVKRGKKGSTFLFRISEGLRSHKIHWYRDGKKKAAIDVLCQGAQTVIPPSVHPETGLPYEWIAGPKLHDVAYDQLPVVSKWAIDEITGFCKTARDPIYALNDMLWCGVGGGGDTHDTCLAAVASMVARGWPHEDIHARVGRAKREAAEASGLPYDWPRAQETIQGWIDSAHAKFGSGTKSSRTVSHGSLADAFLAQGGNHIRYDRDAGTWYFFEGGYWRIRHDFRVLNAIEQSLPIQLRNSQTVSGVEKSLRNRPAMTIRQQDWDPDHHLLNTPNGIVDLTTGLMRPSDPRDLSTRVTSVGPGDSYAESLWCKKLVEWFGDDPGELKYIQTLAGYFLTGETRHSCLPLWIGPGGDGKSVIANTFRYILGDYAKTSTDTAFVDTRQSQHSEELAWLNGARLVLVNEVNGSNPWNDSRIKAVTGGEHIAASYKRGHVFEYRPSFKLLITGNEPPYLRSVGPEFRRRFHVYNFQRGVANPDPELTEKLKAEAGAVLRWMIEGAIMYYRDGLAASPAVKAANAEYFEANDLIQQWITERCDVNEDYRVEGGAAYSDYIYWCESQGLRRPWTRQRFTSKLKGKGVESKTGTFPGQNNSVRGYFGIRLARTSEDRF